MPGEPVPICARRRRLGALAVATGVLVAAAPPATAPLGLWLTEDHGGVIRITRCGDNLCGSIAGQSDAGPAHPELLARCNLPILTAAPAQAGRWAGHITNPEDGRVWSAELWRDSQDRLHLRGYLGLPLLGVTQIWTRYPGRLLSGCRMG